MHRRPVSRLAQVFGEWLRERRGDLGLTLREIIKPTGVAIGWVSELERGIYNPFHLRFGHIIKLAHTYRLKPIALLTRLVELAERTGTDHG